MKWSSDITQRADATSSMPRERYTLPTGYQPLLRNNATYPEDGRGSGRAMANGGGQGLKPQAESQDSAFADVAPYCDSTEILVVTGSRSMEEWSLVLDQGPDSTCTAQHWVHRMRRQSDLLTYH